MNEVEKMYRNVLGYVCNMPDVACFHECEKCDSYITFTAEKQLELIKWLCKKQYVYIIMSADKEYYLCTDNSFISGYNKQFDKALAMFINAYWQDLTDAERTQIKKHFRITVRGGIQDRLDVCP